MQLLPWHIVFADILGWEVDVDGTPFGRYRLIELLGRGGMGEVWRAHDTGTDRMVAIKVLPAHFSESDEFKQRFRREAHAAARLSTPHVIPIHDYGEIDGRLYVNMRLIEGRDLQAVLADGPLEPTRAVRIIEQVALALHAAHTVNLLHRDVKPSNILLDDNDFAYLIDFGIARAADETRLTKSGSAVGTFQYIAPERLGSRAGEDARADIYSLACVLYECLTGSPPFDEDTMAGLVAAHLNSPPPQPSSTRPTVPEQIDQVVATGMAKDPDNRYATTVELARAASEAITTPLPRPIPPTVVDYPDEPPVVPGTVPVTPAPPTTPVPAPAAAPTVAAGQLQSPAAGHFESAPTRHPPPPEASNRHTLDRQMAHAPKPRWWRRKTIIIPAVVLVAALAATMMLVARPAPERSAPRPAYSAQIVLPIKTKGVARPLGLAVDSRDDLYITMSAGDPSSHVLKVAAGSSTPSELPFTDLLSPNEIAVDSAGNVYVVDDGMNQPGRNPDGTVFSFSTPTRVLKFAAGSSSPTELPFTDTRYAAIAVDSAGNVYVADNHSSTSVPIGRVLKLAAGSSSPIEMPFTGLNDPTGIAVDNAGNLYVTDYEYSRMTGRVLKLAAGSSTPTELPLTGPNQPAGVAVDTAGSVYVIEGPHVSGGEGPATARVLKMAAGASAPTELPITGLQSGSRVAVDRAGNVYVSAYVPSIHDDGVVKLPVG